MSDRNIDYYNKNADEYFKDTVDADMSMMRHKFMVMLPENAWILDAGCGSGRDSKAFLNEGFDVTAFDASEAMCKKASEYLGSRVLQLKFEDIYFDRQFDGIWACASLLHVSMGDLPMVMLHMHEALKPGGAMYASFKYGNGPKVRGERKYCDFNERSVIPLFENAGLSVTETQISFDQRPGREEEIWINVFGRR